MNSMLPMRHFNQLSYKAIDVWSRSVVGYTASRGFFLKWPFSIHKVVHVVVGRVVGLFTPLCTLRDWQVMPTIYKDKSHATKKPLPAGYLWVNVFPSQWINEWMKKYKSNHIWIWIVTTDSARNNYCLLFLCCKKWIKNSHGLYCLLLGIQEFN